MRIVQGWLDDAQRSPCEHFDPRPQPHNINLLVIHNISLPPGQFGTGDIAKFFAGKLEPQADPFYPQICDMRVSAHMLVQRDGQLLQFVSFADRAWHAGVSSFQGRKRCNDFSIGIELEGTDDLPYTEQQYAALVDLTKQIMKSYPAITMSRIVGHTDIAPGRKTDPGPAFDWPRYRCGLSSNMT